LVFAVGKERKHYKKSDLPIFLQRFAGFGDLTVEPDELDKYGFIGYIPNTDLMDAGEDYAQMFMTKDALCDDTKWHVRKLPVNPTVEPYFPIGQAALNLRSEIGRLNVSLQTLTPNFKRYEVRMDGADWKPSAAAFAWEIHAGTNRLEARTLNQFGVYGPISTAEIATAK
jgi:hypothetical protein